MPLLSVRTYQNAIENPFPPHRLDRANEHGQNGWRKMQQQGTLGAHHKKRVYNDFVGLCALSSKRFVAFSVAAFYLAQYFIPAINV